KLDQTDHSHVPFVVILLNYVKAYKETHEGQVPQSYQQRQELIKMLRADMRTPDQENFEEAIANISSEVRRIFEDPSCQHANGQSPYFWILARAVRDFVDHEGAGHLPLSGKLPDMKSDTLNYIRLQNVYREKALSDLNAIKQRVYGLIEGTDVSIPEETIETFCKNAASIRVISYKVLSENHLQGTKLAQLLKNNENFNYHFVFEASDYFELDYGRLPTSEDDIEPLKAKVQWLMEERNVATEDTEEILASDSMDKAIIN
ncbi:NEDD8-activating enzyme E1 regulatory subunit, partial [Rhizopus stolonifer]